jgi:cobalt-zinc-cadmium efflux system protein
MAMRAGHDRSHAPAEFGNAFAIGIVLNLAFVAIEAFYGWKRGSILDAFVNAVLLLLAMGSLAWEAAHGRQSPQPVAGVTITVVAAIGIAVNIATALLFLRGRDRDLNVRGALLHMAADAFTRTTPSCGTPRNACTPDSGSSTSRGGSCACR